MDKRYRIRGASRLVQVKRPSSCSSSRRSASPLCNDLTELTKHAIAAEATWCANVCKSHVPLHAVECDQAGAEGEQGHRDRGSRSAEGSGGGATRGGCERVEEGCK